MRAERDEAHHMLATSVGYDMDTLAHARRQF
jgi:hypothetical protein